VKGVKYTFAMLREGRERLCCAFQNSVKEIALASGDKSYAFLRGEGDVHFSLRLRSRYGDDVWSIRFPGIDRDSGLRKCVCYFIKDAHPALPQSATSCTEPAELNRRLAGLREHMDLRAWKQSPRNIVLVSATNAEEVIAVFWKLTNGGYGVWVRTEVGPLVAFAFGLGALMAPRKPK
jgi:hypothetical protein